MISGVCPSCGGALEPLETVDNARNPTFWAGCQPCGRFDWGVSPVVYKIAAGLVDKHHFIAYQHMEIPERGATEQEREYYRKSQIEGATRVVMLVLRIEKEIENP